jgi:hypothetical protein
MLLNGKAALATSILIAVVTQMMSVEVQAALIMNQGFEPPVWDSGANFTPIGTVDDSANGGGIWKGTAGVSYTANVWGSPAGALHLQQGGVASGDIGTDLSSGVVTVSIDLRREFRGGIIGGRSTQQLTQHSGSAAGMLFGVIWEHNFVYDINPAGYYGSQFQAVPSTNNSWNNITFTLDFTAGTYDVAIGETGTLWTGLPLNATAGQDFLRYVHLETISPAQGGRLYFDNVVVDATVVPEPTSGSLVLAGAMLAWCVGRGKHVVR